MFLSRFRRDLPYMAFEVLLPLSTSEASGRGPPAAADQVLSILGQPKNITDLGGKKIYVYPDLKITFKDGKVNDVE